MNKLTSALLILGGLCSVSPLFADSQPEASPSTFARFVPERQDDFAWENDVVAFRSYGPAARPKPENAGIDCWLKRVTYPIVDKWYRLALEEGQSYHEDRGEGLDNYHVGSSAGCGGTSLWLDGKREPLEAFVDWKILEQSRERSSFVLIYEREIGGSVYREEKVITLSLGERLFRVDATFWKDGAVAAGLPVSVGLTTHDGKAYPSFDRKAGWIACWESLDGYGLGTGVALDSSRIEQIVELAPLEKDMGHVLAIARTDAEGRLSYYAGYGWERAGAITSAEKWEAYLAAFSSEKNL